VYQSPQRVGNKQGLICSRLKATRTMLFCHWVSKRTLLTKEVCSSLKLTKYYQHVLSV